MSINFQEILKELEYRVEHGIIDLTKEEQVTKLTQILKENGVSDANEMAQKTRVYFSYINEAPKKQPLEKVLAQKFENPDTGNQVTVASALGYEKKSQAYNIAKGMMGKSGYSEKDIDMVDTAPGDEEVPVAKPNAFGKEKGAKLGGGDYELDIEKDKNQQPKKSKPVQQYNSNKGLEQMSLRDGTSFDGYRSGKLKAPGTAAGAFPEVAGMLVSGYLRQNPNASDAEIEKYLSDWSKKGKVTKQPKVSGGDKMTAAIHTGRAIYEHSNRIASEEGYDPKTTTVEGYWGAEESKVNAIRRIDEIVKENPKATFNGMSADEYKNIIKQNGAGENPTDSMVMIWDGKSNNVSFLHISNKVGSNNIQANSSVKQTFNRAINIVTESDLNPQQKEAANTLIKKRQNGVTKLQKDQIEYQTSFLPKFSRLTSSPKILREMTKDIYGETIRRGGDVDNLFTDRGAIGKECKKLQKPHPSCKLVGKNAKPEVKVKAMFEFYKQYPNLAPAAVREIISRTSSLQDSSGKPKYKVGYDSSVINALYGKMNDQVEGMRQDLNKIKPGFGDRMLAKDFASRLHLTIAEGHNPGGIPHDKFILVMGNNEADIWYDKTQQGYEKINNQYYKINDDGSLDKNPTKLNQREINRGNIATIGDDKNFRHCLGVPKGKSIEEFTNVKYGKINTKTGIQKAHIFDINGKEIGIMVIRSKQGPGGDANDTLQFSKDMQNCMQKQEYLKKRNKR
jgi:hypothetical protein